MKTKNFLFILLLPLLFSQGVKGQGYEFAPLGAKWNYSTYFWGQTEMQFSKTIDVTEDTIIQGKFCKKLCLSDNSNNCYSKEFLYDSSGVVKWYMAENDSFVVLYDFNANQGDTWTLFVHTYPQCPDTFTVHVDSVDYIIINNQTLKVLYLSTIDQLNSYYYLQGPTIELFGNVEWMFPQSSFCVAEETNYFLRCYEDNMLGLYKADSEISHFYPNFISEYYLPWEFDCDSNINFSSINEQYIDQNYFSVYPTICSDYLNVIINYLNFSDYVIEYRIFNSLGQLVKVDGISASKPNIYIGDYKHGLYKIIFFFRSEDNSSKYFISTNYTFLKL